MAILIRGLRGTPVKMIQEKLGLTADGIFGAGTERALKEYQKANGLSADGIAGPDTFAAMGLYDLIILKKGAKGQTVKKVQEALDIGADGKFGAGTEKAVCAFQEAHGLDADGIVGPATVTALGLFAPETPAESEPAVAPPPAVKEVWNTVEEITAGAMAQVKKILPFDF
jgi:peptidoglycan hydrolase-like protein with peptidoglycan-binding domain